jgi:hypothetical protein
MYRVSVLSSIVLLLQSGLILLFQQSEATSAAFASESMMVTATVDVSEVIPVENTPPQPPPLPEPPPICDIEPAINDHHRWLHSGTSIDGEKILSRSMNRVEGKVI